MGIPVTHPRVADYIGITNRAQSRKGLAVLVIEHKRIVADVAAPKRVYVEYELTRIPPPCYRI